MMSFLLLAVTLLSLQKDSLTVTVESDTATIDPARNIFLTLTVKAPREKKFAMPDFRERVRGFSRTEDFAEEPIFAKDGSCTYVVKWMLTPEPVAKTYKIAPFALGETIVGPIYFNPPPPRETVTGAMEIDPQKDLAPLRWKIAGFFALALASFSLLIFASIKFAKWISRRIKEHRMSPIERAWAELARLMKKDWPSHGRFKDFYVELTMVVRRYVQRKYGISAPHLTTEEFLNKVIDRADFANGRARLANFLASADLVKFAGLQATREMADEATAGARAYLKEDEAEATK